MRRVPAGPCRLWVRATIGLLLVAASLAPRSFAHAAVVSDLSITVTGPATGQMLSTQTYTWTVTNSGPDTDDGAVVQLAASHGYLDPATLTCSASGGAVCPSFTSTSPATATLTTLPAGAMLRLTSRVTLQFTGTTTVVGSVTAANDTDPDISSNRVSMDTTVDVPPPTPTLVHSNEMVAPDLGVPYGVTDTVANRGVTTMSDVHILATLSGNGVTSSWTQPVCTSTGGAVCPTGLADGSASADGTVIDLVVPTIPPGGSLSFSYQLTNRDPVPVCGDTYGVGFQTTADGPGLTTARAVGVVWPTPLTDAVVDSSVSTQHASGGQRLTLSVLVGSMCGTIQALPFTWTLPAAEGFVVGDPLATLVCTPSYGTCPAFRYDPATRVISTTFPQVGPNLYTLSLTGTAGIQPGSTWASTAEVVDPLDLTPGTNTTQALYDITNPTWQLNVSFILDPDSALPPVDVVMTGTLHCAAAGDRAWTLRMAAGTDRADGPRVVAWQGDACTFIPDPLPAAPTGYHWAGAVVGTGTVFSVVSDHGFASFSARLVPDASEVPVLDPPTMPKPVSPGDVAGLPAALASTGTSVAAWGPWTSCLLVLLGASLTVGGHRARRWDAHRSGR